MARSDLRVDVPLPEGAVIDGPVFKLELVRHDHIPGEGIQGNFYGANGELVWWTEAYSDRRDAVRAIELLKLHAADAPVIAEAGVAGDRAVE